MRASVASLSKKLISSLFAATLAVGLVPAAAFAAEDLQVESDQNIESTEQDESNPRVISTEDPQGHDPHVISTEDPQGPSGEISSQDEYASEDSTSVIPAENIINQTMPLETVAQQESTRSYFLAQTLESTRTIPMVSANLPLDEGTAEEVVEANDEGTPEDEGGEDSDESDLWAAPIASESTVIGSFTSRGLTYAVEPGGETVALVAADYNQLPEQYIEAATIVIPAAVTPDAIDYYSVTRLADYAFASLAHESVGASFMWRSGEETIEANAEASAATSTLDSSDGASENAPTCITTLTIPESATTIDTNAFTDFATLQYLVVSPDNLTYSSYDGALYDADQTRLLLIPGGRLGAVRVAPSVTEVDPEAFSHCPSVDTLVADANSAAYQLLSENDIHNANGDAIEVVTLDGVTTALLDPAPYEEMMLAEQGLGTASSLSAVGSLSERAVLNAYYPIDITYHCVPDVRWTWTWNMYKDNPSAADIEKLDNGGATYNNASPFVFSKGVAWRFYYGWATDQATKCKVNITPTYTGNNNLPPVYWTITAASVSKGYWLDAGYTSATFASKSTAWTTAKDIWMKATPNTYTITFHDGGADANARGTQSKDVTYNAAVSAIAVPRKTGYNFQGYYALADINEDGSAKDLSKVWFDASGKYVKEKTFVDIAGNNEKSNWGTASNTVLYAAWSPKTYEGDNSVTLNLQGADAPAAAQTISPTYDALLPTVASDGSELVVPRRSGYEFAGFWSTQYDESDTSKKYYDDDGTGKLAPVADKTWDMDPGTLYAHWKYKVVLNLNAFDALGNASLTEAGDAFDASLPADYTTDEVEHYALADGRQVEVYVFDAIDGTAVTLPASVTRTGYNAANQWNTKADLSGTTYKGTLAAPFKPTLSETSTTGLDNYDHKALVLFADWKNKARTFKVTLTSDYTADGVTFKAASGATTEITAQYDAPLLKEKDGKVVTWAGENEVIAPKILNSDGTFAYAFAGYYSEKNSLDTSEGTCWMGSVPVTGDTGYEGAAVAVPSPNVVYRTAGPSQLYARWTRVESGLTLDPQGGTFAGSTSPVKVENFVLTANQEVDHLKAPYNAVPTRPGYRFAGWWSASTKTSSAAYATYAQDETTKRYFEAPTPSSNAVVSTGLTWPYYTDTTLYAHWEYDLGFDASAGSDTASFSFTASGQGTPSSGTMPALTPEGGAYKDAFGNLYHFEGTDQTSAIASITVLDGTPVALPAYGERLRAGERAGYALAGFYATSACTGDALASTTLSGNVAPVGGSASVYADWDALSYTVSLKAKEYDGFAYRDLTQDMATTPVATVTATYDSPLPSTDNILPVMRGYSFLGWFDAPQTDEVTGATDPSNYSVYGATKFYDRSGPVTSAKWTKTADADLVLYAHYRQIPYTLTFELGPGETLSGVDNPLDVFYGYSLSGVTAKPYLDGYDFAGWKVKDSSETSPLFSATGQGRGLYLTEGNTTLVPSWSGKTYKITWMLDYAVDDDFAYDHCAAAGLKGGMVTDDTVLYNRPVAIPDAAAYEAYGFHGWFTDKDAALDRVASKNALDLYFERTSDGAYVFKPRNDQDVSELVFYASWGSDTDPFSPVTYTVSVHAGNRSSFAPETQTEFHRSYGDEQGPVVLSDFVDELTSRAHAGWAFAGWNETTGGMDEPYDDTTVPLGTGDRAFTAQWEPDKQLDYTIAFQKGRSEINSRSAYPYDYVSMERDGAVLSDKRAISFDASVTGFTLPYFTQGEDTVTETLGFTFKGWFRADADWNVIEDEPLAKSVYGGQELADIAKDAGTTTLKYVAVWEPKDFQVLYAYSESDATLMDGGSYDSAPVSYLHKVTLASPSYERDRAAIFDRWEGATSTLSDPLVPGRANLSVADLVRKTTDARVDRAANTVTLTGIWTEAYSFTVPLTVNIAIDPERAEGTVKGQGFISTSATRELKIASVTFTRDENLSDTLYAKGADRTQGDVFLAIEGDDAASPLLVDLSQGADPVYTKEHDALAAHGLTSVRAANANTPATLGVTYDLVIREGADVTFADFTKLLEKKDIRDEHKNLASTSIGRVMYTLTLR